MKITNIIIIMKIFIKKLYSLYYFGIILFNFCLSNNYILYLKNIIYKNYGKLNNNLKINKSFI